MEIIVKVDNHLIVAVVLFMAQQHSPQSFRCWRIARAEPNAFKTFEFNFSLHKNPIYCIVFEALKWNWHFGSRLNDGQMANTNGRDWEKPVSWFSTHVKCRNGNEADDRKMSYRFSTGRASDVRFQVSPSAGHQSMSIKHLQNVKPTALETINPWIIIIRCTRVSMVLVICAAGEASTFDVRTPANCSVIYKINLFPQKKALEGHSRPR